MSSLEKVDSYVFENSNEFIRLIR